MEQQKPKKKKRRAPWSPEWNIARFCQIPKVHGLPIIETELDFRCDITGPYAEELAANIRRKRIKAKQKIEGGRKYLVCEKYP